MMFLIGELSEYNPKKTFKHWNSIDTGYPTTDMDKLAVFRCPNCKDNQLFRGLVYIGCKSCICWFSEEDIILENLIGGN